MSTLTARLNATKQNMYSVDGAKFQEYAIQFINASNKNSEAHKSIGKFVTAINNNQMTVNEAIAQYNSLLK